MSNTVEMTLVGAAATVDEAIDRLLESGHDCRHHERGLSVRGQCPQRAQDVVAPLGWRVESWRAVSDA